MLPASHRSSLISNTSSATGRAQQVSSAADLTAAVRRTSGPRPPPLVGCSITLIGDAIYVFGGRLVPTRTMASTLYRLDLRTLAWTFLWGSPPTPSSSPGTEPPPLPLFPSSDATGPQARYFHSACAWGDKLVIFGGEGYEPTTPGGTVAAEDDPSAVPALRTLDDVCIWDTKEGRWIESETKCRDGVERPAPRYAHLGAVTTTVVEDEGGRREKSVMLVMGGQDIRNTYLHSMNVLDLETLTWVHAGHWDRHIGTYRAVCTAPSYTVVQASVSPPQEGLAPAKLGLEENEKLTQLSYSERSVEQKPEPLLLFSNFNFTQVRRDLDLLDSPLSSTPLAATSLSSSMAGPSLPPGLRFPTGTIIGRHLLVFGTFLSHAVNNFSVWAFDLGPAGAGGIKDRIARGEKLEWMRIDPGSVLAKGSWNRAVGWGNSVVVLGDRERDIAADYDHRQTNFTHIAALDLESFGIYQPPPRRLPPAAQAFGLLTLSQPALSDFEIVCSDGKRLGCSRKVLEDRWPWFASRLAEFKQRASGVQSAQQVRDADSTGPIEVPPTVTDDAAADAADAKPPATPSADDLRLTPRTLTLPEPSPVVQAFLQYLHTLALSTSLQLHPPVLAALVVFARTYDDVPLRAACVHALHGVLERESAAAPLVYEAATLSGATALQIRSLRTMLSNPSMRARPAQVPPIQAHVTASRSHDALPLPPPIPALSDIFSLPLPHRPIPRLSLPPSLARFRSSHHTEKSVNSSAASVASSKKKKTATVAPLTWYGVGPVNWPPPEPKPKTADLEKLSAPAPRRVEPSASAAVDEALPAPLASELFANPRPAPVPPRPPTSPPPPGRRSSLPPNTAPYRSLRTLRLVHPHSPSPRASSDASSFAPSSLAASAESRLAVAESSDREEDKPRRSRPDVFTIPRRSKYRMDELIGWAVAAGVAYAAYKLVFVPQESIDQITSMFPHVSPRAARWELERNGGSVERAVERALREGALPEPPASYFPPPPNASSAPTPRPATPTPAGPASSSSSGPRAPPPSLIQKMGLQSRAAMDDSDGGKGKAKEEEAGKGWSTSAEERERNLRARKEKLVLEARRKLMEKERLRKEAAAASSDFPSTPPS
ncbi:hypothetical protein JCM10207_003352 [Rhodosporidiobolus poonsookiae]